MASTVPDVRRSAPGIAADRIAAGYFSLERAQAWLDRVDLATRRDNAPVTELRALLDHAKCEFDRAKRLLDCA